MITLLLYVAEQSNRYFARDEILNMLNAFIPLLTREVWFIPHISRLPLIHLQTYAVMIPVITSFLPPSHTNLYLPALFKIWEGFNSSLIDDRFLHLAGHLSEEHVSGLSGDAGEGGAKWKDVGIWCETEWDILVSKGLGSMSEFPCATITVDSPHSQMSQLGKAGYVSPPTALQMLNLLYRVRRLLRTMPTAWAIDTAIRSKRP